MAEDEYTVEIDERLCKGCFLCVWTCPVDALRESDRRNERGYRLPEYVGGCRGCRQCELICPDLAIEVRRKGEGS
ncbi:4Fe-4S dicluster domain-containing protein [Methanopyrus sp.]